MADDYQDLAPLTTKFVLEPDWSNTIAHDFGLAREIYQYDKGKLDFYNLTDRLSNSIEYGFLNVSKEDEYTITDFFNDRKGQHEKFWLPIWNNEFKLHTSILNYDSEIIVYNRNFHETKKGYERFFIKTTNGDMITRFISAVIDNGDGTETIQLSYGMTRDIPLTDILFFGRFMVVRFDQDELEMSFATDRVSKCSLKFRELVYEYPVDPEDS